jgi:hypothetical protein
MKALSEIFKSLLNEMGDDLNVSANFNPNTANNNTNSDPNLQNSMENNNDQLLEFPNSNFVVSLFGADKKLLFSPQSHESLPNKVRTMVNMIKQNFKVSQIEQKDMGAFEITLSPQENFDGVVNFIKQEMERDGNY